MKKIKVQIKTAYGNDNIYPFCDTAKFFAKLAGTKTLTSKLLYIIKNEGYEIEYINSTTPNLRPTI